MTGVNRSDNAQFFSWVATGLAFLGLLVSIAGAMCWEIETPLHETPASSSAVFEPEKIGYRQSTLLEHIPSVASFTGDETLVFPHDDGQSPPVAMMADW